MIREAFRNWFCKHVSLQIEAKSDESVCWVQQQPEYFLYWSDVEFNVFNNFSRKSFQHTRHPHSFHLLLASFTLFCPKELTTASITLVFAPDKGKNFWMQWTSVKKCEKIYSKLHGQTQTKFQAFWHHISSLSNPTPRDSVEVSTKQHTATSKWHSGFIMGKRFWELQPEISPSVICTSSVMKNKHMLSGETSHLFKLDRVHISER